MRERELKLELFKRQKGKCARCGGTEDWRGWQKHEIIFRSQGGDPLDINNCELLCGKCGSKAHNIREVDSESQWTKGGK